MTDTLTTPARTPQDKPTPRPCGSARWWTAVVIGCALALPFGILLSYVAFLMAYLGLFFYALFGLLIGAIVHRVAGGLRCSVGRASLTVGTTLIVLVGLGTSLKWEIDGLPTDMANQTFEHLRRLPEGVTKEAYRADAVDRTRRYIDERYPPGGALGYVRWVLDSGRIEAGTFEGVDVALGRSQRRWIWAIRIVLSAVLFAFGVGSLTFSLSPRRKPEPSPSESEAPVSESDRSASESEPPASPSDEPAPASTS